jgi:hypothetical protein
MILRAADADGEAVELLCAASQIGVKFVAELGIAKQRGAVLRRENRVDQDA